MSTVSQRPKLLWPIVIQH